MNIVLIISLFIVCCTWPYAFIALALPFYMARERRKAAAIEAEGARIQREVFEGSRRE
jgi:hypothetical protein